MSTSTRKRVTSAIRYVYGVTLNISALILILLAAPLAYADPVSIELNYHCTYPLIGVQPMSVIVNSDMPDTLPVGQSSGAFNLAAVATAQGNTWMGLNIVSATSLGGTANSYSNISGNNLSLDLDVPLTISRQDVPAVNGDFDLLASGQTPPLTFSPLNIGELTISVGNINLTLLALKSDGSPVIFAESDPETGIFPAPCTLDEGQDNVLHRFTITPAEPDPSPEISISPNAVAFGDTQAGTTDDIALTISNQGNASLVVDSITISGTDASEYLQSNDCSTIAAAQTCIITVSFSPSGEGARTAALTILSNDADSPTLTVALSGHGVFASEPHISLSTSQINFSEVQAGVTEDMVIAVNNIGTAALLINGMITISGADSSEFFQENDCTTIIADSQCTVTISFTPSGEGLRSATLTILSNDTDSPTLQVSLIGEGVLFPAPEILISPTTLSFGELPAGNSADLSAIISNNGAAPLVINSIFINGTNASEFSQIHNCSSVEPNESCAILVTFTPSGSGSRTASLTVQSDDPDSPTFKVALTGQASLLPEPEISLSTTSIDFSTVQIGNDANRLVTITNSGTAELNISSVSLAGTDASEFLQTHNCSVVAPLGSCTLFITFSPISEGTKSAEIHIASNSISNPATAISLSAHGTSQPQPNIAVAPNALIFSSTLVGGSSQITVTVANLGNAPLTISDVTISGDDAASFSQTNDCSTIGIFSICTLIANFNPNEAGERSASLTIRSNDPDSPAFNVPLSGHAELTAQPIMSTNLLPMAFGEIPIDDTASNTLTINNIGSQPLSVAISLSGIDSSSFFQMDDGSCAAIAPSDSCTVTVSFSPTIEGSRAATLYLSTNAPSTPEIEIPLTGSGTIQLHPVISVSPLELDFASTEIGSTNSLRTFISNTGSGDLSVSSIAIAGTHAAEYSMSHDCADILASEDCDITVTFAPSEVGLREATLTINSNDLDRDLVTVSLSGNALTAPTPHLSLDNRTLLFAATTVGQSETLTIIATNSGTENLNVSSISVSGTDATSFTLSHNCSQLSPRADCAITAFFSPTSIGHKAAALTLNSDDPETPTVVIPMSGSALALPSPSIAVDSTAMTFGAHQVGTNSDQVITVSNTGSANLDLTGIAISGATSFSQTNDCTTIIVGGSCTIQIRFSPSTETTDSATLTLTSNDIDTPTLSITLDGTGTPIPLPIITASVAEFGGVVVNETRQRDITIENTGSANLMINSISIGGTDSADFTLEGNCDSAISPSQTCTLTLAYSPTTISNSDAVLIILSNAAENASLSIPLIAEGLALPQPGLTISTESLSFGEVEPGNAKQLVLVAENTGSTTLSLMTSVSGTDRGSFFPFKSDHCRSLPPTETCTIHVSFAPSSAGLKSAELQISSAALAIQVALSGSGGGYAPAVPPTTTDAPQTTNTIGEKPGGVGSFNVFMFLLVSLLALRLSTRRNPLGPRYRRRLMGNSVFN